MQTFAQSGAVLDLDPGASVPAGVGHLFGSVFGVAALDAVSGTQSSFVTEGVVSIAKTNALAINVGDPLYWDPAAREVNKTSTDQQQVGIAIAAAADPSATVQMLMRGAAAGGPGGGATAFTQLTDAPATLVPNLLLSTNADGTLVEMKSWLEVGDAGEYRYVKHKADPVQGGDCTLMAGENQAAIVQYVDENTASLGIYVNGEIGAAMDFAALADGTARIRMNSGNFEMANFDVVATDTAARLTVDGTSYGIAKAIQVKIGADTHYWPLFGGEDAGPAPSAGSTQLAPVDYLDENFSDFSTGVVDTTAAPYNSTATEGQSVICAYPSTPADAGIWVLGVMTDPAAVPVTRRADALTGATFTKGQVIRVGSSVPPSTFARCLPNDPSYTNWQDSGVIGTDILEFNPANDGGLLSIASANGAIASGNFSTASGIGATASGQYSVASGASSTASGNYSTASGSNSTARVHGSEAHAAGLFNVQGDAQVGRYVLKCITTDGVPQYALADSEFIVPPNNASFDFNGRLVAREPATKDSKSWKFEGLIKRGADATDMYIVSAVTPVAGDTGASAWTVEVRSDDGNLAVVVTGEADKTIQWVCSVNTVETIG